MRLIDREEISARLTYELCIPLMRTAMISLSSGEALHLLRSIIPLADGRLFGLMPGALGPRAAFGAKLLSVFPGNFDLGRQSHQGLVILFDPDTGEPVCAAHAGEVTAIRTAAASAAATDALARKDASCLGVLGYGEQALTHARAMMKVRPIRAIHVWGRRPERLIPFCRGLEDELGVPVVAAADAETVARAADILCAVTAAREPILKGAWVNPGAHVNLVGSSVPGPVEADQDLVVRARFIADCREGVLRQGAEFLKAKEAGAIGDDHIVAEIGEVFAGTRLGRRTDQDVTIYKSLGHIVQDLASVWALYGGRGTLG